MMIRRCKHGLLRVNAIGRCKCEQCLAERKLKDKERSRRYREANEAQIAERRLSNAARHKVWHRSHYTRNKAAYIAKAAYRDALILKRTVAWADRKAITEIYRKARNLTEQTGIEHHVDHVLPLQGKTVCGLHVENNLQILTAKANKAKSNRLDP